MEDFINKQIREFELSTPIDEDTSMPMLILRSAFIVFLGSSLRAMEKEMNRRVVEKKEIIGR